MGERASRATLVVLVFAALGLGSCAGARPAGSSRLVVAAKAKGSSLALASCPTAVRRLGLITFIARGQLDVVDLATCRATVLRSSGAVEPRFSPDGRWLAYAQLVNGNPTRPVVIPAVGGPPHSPLGGGIIAWSWAPTGELLYGLTSGGSLIAASPTGRRRIVSTHLGLKYYVGSFDVSPDGNTVSVNRSTCGPQPPVGELDTINVHTGVRSVVLRQAGRFVTFAGWSPDGRWLLFWPATQCSASLAADGWPLEAVPATGGKPVQVVRHMLLFSDFLSWCGTRLIAAAGPDRETQLGSALVGTQPPAWREHTLQSARKLSWVSPACAPSGRLLAVAAGPNTNDAGFGVEHRSIWLLRADGAAVRQLTTPPARYLSDEAPRFSDDGRWILFVRSRVVPVGQAAFSRDTIELVRASGGGNPVPVIDFTSNDFSYYDHFDWPDEIDWYQPR
jgi:Tol biopolymer transport system component